ERVGHARRAERLERTVDDWERLRLRDLERRHARRCERHDHGLVPDARCRQHVDDHVRGDRRRRPGGDRTLVGRCTGLAGAGAKPRHAHAKPAAAGTLANLSSSPSITVPAGDGSGTLATGTVAVNASSTGNTITFTYTAATGGLASGSVTLAVPSGWSAPSTSGSAAGYTTASTGSVSAAGQTVTVSGITLAGGSTFTITYGSNACRAERATAPRTAATHV